MNDIQTKQRVLLSSLAVALVIGVAGYFLIEDALPFWLGLLLGTAVGALMFLQMAKSIEDAVSFDPAQAQLFMVKRYMIRMAIYLVTLFASIRANHVNILGTLLGLLSIKAAVVLLAILNRYRRE